MVTDIFRQNEIVYKDDTHQYFGENNKEYSSVTRIVQSIKVPFDRNTMSLMMARSIAKETGVTVDKAQQELLSEWESNKNNSTDKGNYVHDGLEEYVRTGKVMEGLEEPVKYMQNVFKQYYRFYPEVILFSHEHKVAGRTDMALQRQKNDRPVLDFIDYKTNASKGIQFDSISRKEGILKHYNRFCLAPFEYFESCNYNDYSLQLSIYAFLAMTTLNVRIGKLAIVFFDNNFHPTYIPVPFMYHEAELLCRLNITRKELPDFHKVEVDPIKLEMQRRQHPVTEKESFKIKDDWD